MGCQHFNGFIGDAALADAGAGQDPRLAAAKLGRQLGGGFDPRRGVEGGGYDLYRQYRRCRWLCSVFELGRLGNELVAQTKPRVVILEHLHLPLLFSTWASTRAKQREMVAIRLGVMGI